MNLIASKARGKRSFSHTLYIEVPF